MIAAIASHFGEPSLSTFEILWLVLVPFVLYGIAAWLLTRRD